jgi:selenide,water dikinase
MAQGSGCTPHITAGNVPFHKEALEFADMGFIPAGAYRNREYAGHGVSAAGISRPMLDIMYDPQTSGGLLIAAPEEEAGRMLRRFADEGISASAIGYVTEKNEDAPYVVVE